MSYLYLLKRQFEQSIAAAEHAVALEPNSALNYSVLSNALCWSGKYTECIAADKKAGRLDPVFQDTYLLAEAAAYNAMGRCADAVPLLKRFIARFPDEPLGHGSLAIAYIELGREADARAQAAEILLINPQFTLVDPKKSPLKDLALRERYNADLRKAGLKVAGLPGAVAYDYDCCGPGATYPRRARSAPPRSVPHLPWPPSGAVQGRRQFGRLDFRKHMKRLVLEPGK